MISKLWNYPSAIGDKYGIDWLTYNPGVFLEFAMVARRNAPLFTSALVATFPDAKTFNDVGCGTGQFVLNLQKLGKDARGYEYSRTARLYGKLIGVDIKSFDLSLPAPIKELSNADVCYSLEVGEHIPDFLSGKFVETLIAAGKIIVFTAAQPGQPGHGHINCQSKEYWAKEFNKRGYVNSASVEQDLTMCLKKQPRLSRFLIDNLQVFVKEGRG